MRRFIRFMVIEGAMGGMFVYRTPKEFTVGYNDPIVSILSKQPLYKGGDGTSSPLMSINTSPTSPNNYPIAFFTGDGDYLFTRRFALWLDRPFITVKRKEYTTLTKMEDVYVEPWAERVYVRLIFV
jgi:hypothetical protein